MAGDEQVADLRGGEGFIGGVDRPGPIVLLLESRSPVCINDRTVQGLMRVGLPKLPHRLARCQELRGQLWDEFVSQLRDVRRRGGVELGQARMIFHDIHGANDLFVMVDLFLESLQLGTEVVTLRIEISIALEHGGHINELRDAYPSSPRGGRAESVRALLPRAGAAFAGTGRRLRADGAGTDGTFFRH